MIPLLADAFFIAMAVTIIFGLMIATVLTMLVVRFSTPRSSGSRSSRLSSRPEDSEGEVWFKPLSEHS